MLDRYGARASPPPIRLLGIEEAVQVSPREQQEVLTGAVHHHHQAVRKLTAERRRDDVETIGTIGTCGERSDLARVIVWPSSLALAAIHVNHAAGRQLVDDENETAATFASVDTDAFSITLNAGRAEQRELAIGASRVGIGVPLVDAGTFVGVVHEAELVIDGYCFDFSAAAEIAEPSHEGRLHAIRASPMSRSRRCGSRSRQRRSNCRIAGGASGMTGTSFISDLPGDRQRFLEWQRALRDPVRKRRPFDEFHDERGDAR